MSWKKENKEAYNKKGKNYDSYRPLKLYIHLAKHFSKTLLNYIPKKANVLDICCGTGNSTVFIDSIAENSKITCVDQAKNMLDVAKTKKFINKTSFILSDLESYNSKKKFDVIQIFQATHHFSSMKPITKMLKRNLSKDGYVFLIDFFTLNKIIFFSNKIYIKYLGQGKYYIRNYLETIKELEKEGFETIKYVEHPVLKNYGIIIAKWAQTK